MSMLVNTAENGGLMMATDNFESPITIGSSLNLIDMPRA